VTRAQAIDRVLTAEDRENDLARRFVSVATATTHDLRALRDAKRSTANALDVLASFSIDHTTT
jgi:hypothetical protein